MQLQNERDEIVEYCRKLGASGLSPGTSGNISVFNHAAGLMAISPSSMDYDRMTDEDVVLMDLSANVVEGRLRPSTEFAMHLGCYRKRSDIAAVVHTHAPQCTTLAVLGWDLPAVHYMIALSGQALIRCAPYRLFGTPELAEEAVSYLGKGYACLLQNHGTLAGGPNMAHAWSLTQQMEFCAEIYLRARVVGEPNILTDQQITDVIGELADYSAQK